MTVFTIVVGACINVMTLIGYSIFQSPRLLLFQNTRIPVCMMIIVTVTVVTIVIVALLSLLLLLLRLLCLLFVDFPYRCSQCSCFR